jgi:hypothetical protein
MTYVEPADLIDSAMCLWEDVMERLAKPEKEAKRHDLAVKDARYRMGTAGLRWKVAALAEPCHVAWEYAQRAHGYEECFDWEWAPWFLRRCVEWDGVTLRPDWQSIVDEDNQRALEDLYAS